GGTIECAFTLSAHFARCTRHAASTTVARAARGIDASSATQLEARIAHDAANARATGCFARKHAPTRLIASSAVPDVTLGVHTLAVAFGEARVALDIADGTVTHGAAMLRRNARH